MTQVNFKPIFPSPLGYVNFGNSNKDLNKQLIKDMEKERKEDIGKNATFKTWHKKESNSINTTNIPT